MSKQIFDRLQPYKQPLQFVAAGLAGILVLYCLRQFWPEAPIQDPRSTQPIPPLVMEGGDPYLRSLMRTISTSEANGPRPYSLIYGGGRAANLDRHPNKCVKIQAGPNKGNCSTAAGRYQTINTTWYEIAQRYNAKQICFFWECHYSFAPIEQDKAVHAWLSDKKFWGIDISQELRAGKIAAVRKKLSPTWTSLGYGIETNVMTSKLDQAFADILDEELKRNSTRN